MKLSNNSGFSLVEVMIALTITGLITAAVFGTFRTQHEHYMAQDDITTIQQSARISIDEITRQVRMAGYGVPNEVSSIKAANTNPDTITLMYQFKDCQASLSEAMPQPSAELKCSDVSCYEDGQQAFIWEPDSLKGEFFTVTSVQTESSHLQHNTNIFARVYGAGSLVLSLTSVKFYVNHTTDADHPRLMVKYGDQPAQVYADDVSDLQFRYRMRDGSVVDVPTLPTDVREVLISLTGRSARQNVDDADAPYRLRTYASSASLRNLGL